MVSHTTPGHWEWSGECAMNLCCGLWGKGWVRQGRGCTGLGMDNFNSFSGFWAVGRSDISDYWSWGFCSGLQDREKR